LCRSPHHVLAYAGAAGKDQVIERQRTERLADLGISEHHAQLVRVEVAGHQLAEQLGRPRGQFGRFEHGGIAGRVYPRTGATRAMVFLGAHTLRNKASGTYQMDLSRKK